MTTPKPPMWGFLCDRCNRAYRTPHFPSEALCRSCHLGALSPVDRAAALVNPWGKP